MNSRSSQKIIRKCEILVLISFAFFTWIGVGGIAGCVTTEEETYEYRPPTRPSAPLCIPGTRMAHVRVVTECADIIVGPREAGLDIDEETKALGIKFKFKMSSNLIASKLAKRTGTCSQEVRGTLSKKIQQSIESALKAKGYLIVPDPADADLHVTVRAQASTMRHIKQVSVLGGDGRTYQCAKRCGTTSCPGFSWEARTIIRLTISVNLPGMQPARIETFEVGAPVRRPRDAEDQTDLPRREYFCDLDEAEAFVEKDALYDWGGSVNAVHRKIRTASRSLFCNATGGVHRYRRNVRKQVVEWNYLSLQKSDFSITPSHRSLARVDIAIQNLAECKENSPYSLRFELADKNTIQSCAVPEFGPPILLLEARVKNGTEHILWLRDILPLVVTERGQKLSPSSVLAAMKVAWSGLGNQPAAVVQSPHDKADPSRVALMQIASFRPFGELLDLIPAWSPGSFVLPHSQERFLLVFDLRSVIQPKENHVRFTVGFYDVIGDTNRAGETTLKDSAIFDGSLSVQAILKQTGKLVMKTVQEMTSPDELLDPSGNPLIPDTAPPEAEPSTGEADSENATENAFVVQSLDDIADLTIFLRNHVGDEVVVQTRNGDSTQGAIKGVWSMNLSIDASGVTKNISLGTISSVKVLGPRANTTGTNTQKDLIAP